MQIFKITLIILASFIVFSCRNHEIPEDIHEHEEINKLNLVIKETGSSAVQTVSYQSGTGSSSVITLTPGKTYEVDLAFYHHHNGVDEDKTAEIIQEKDEHFVQYQFSGAQIMVMRAANDEVRSDGKKLGLKTTWVVNAAPANSGLLLQLIHGSASVNDTDNDGGGSAVGGEADVNAPFAIN